MKRLLCILAFLVGCSELGISPESGMATIVVRNRVASPIHALLMANCDEDDFGDDWLGDATIAPGADRSFTLEPGCWDVGAVTVDSRFASNYGIDLEEGEQYDWLVNSTEPLVTPGPGSPGTGTTGVNDAQVVVMTSGLYFPFNIVVDPTTVYWNDAGNGIIGSVLINAPRTARYIVGAGTSASHDLDQDATYIYFSYNSFTLWRVPKAGGLSTNVIPSSRGLSPSGFRVTGGRIIFGNSLSGSGVDPNSGPSGFSGLMSVTTAGTGYATFGNSPATVLLGMVVAISNSHVYFGSIGRTSGNMLRSVPIGGGTATALTGVYDLTAIAAPASSGSSGPVYYIESAAGADRQTLRRFAGGTVTVIDTVMTLNSASIAIDDGFVYYPRYDPVSGGSMITRRSLTTGARTTLAGPAKTGGIAGGLAVDGRNVYWSVLTGNEGSGSIRLVPK